MQKLKRIIKRCRSMKLTGYEKIQLFGGGAGHALDIAEAIETKQYHKVVFELSLFGVEAYGVLKDAYERTKDRQD